ncbi:hypothetical protein OP161_RS25115, partial [Escherichia coli]
KKSPGAFCCMPSTKRFQHTASSARRYSNRFSVCHNRFPPNDMLCTTVFLRETTRQGFPEHVHYLMVTDIMLNPEVIMT